MRRFLYRLIFLSPATLGAVFGIFLFSMCGWMTGVLVVRFVFVFVFGFAMPDVVSFLFPLGRLSALVMIAWFGAASFYIGYLWDTRGEKGGGS